MPNDTGENWGKYLGYGLETVVGAFLGYYIGHWLEQRFHWQSWVSAAGLMIGVASGMYLMIRDALKENKE